LTSPARQPYSPSRPLQGGWPDERRASFRRVECGRCGAAAEVAKFSAQQTSVQWTAASVLACAEFRARAADGEQSALIDTCVWMRDSIEAAVAKGHLEVSPP
jgi:hypothetical protein